MDASEGWRACDSTLNEKERCANLPMMELSCPPRPPSVGSKLKCPLFVAHDMSGFKLISRRRGGGKVGIRRSLRDFQARWESRLYDFSSERLFHGPLGEWFGGRQRRALRRISSRTMRSVSKAQVSIQMLMNHHLAAGQRRPPAHPLNL